MIILIIPIGAPGSGKTTLKNHLKDVLPNFYTTERDVEFAKLRKNNSLKKTRKIFCNSVWDDPFARFIEVNRISGAHLWVIESEKALLDRLTISQLSFFF